MGDRLVVGFLGARGRVLPFERGKPFRLALGYRQRRGRLGDPGPELCEISIQRAGCLFELAQPLATARDLAGKAPRELSRFFLVKLDQGLPDRDRVAPRHQDAPNGHVAGQQDRRQFAGADSA